MGENPYDRFRGDDLILRDELAIDRTILANERTVLAYFRGAISLVIVGITFIHFADMGQLLFYVGLACLPLGLAVGVFGYGRYRKMDREIKVVRRALGTQPTANGGPRSRTAGAAPP